MAETPRRRGGAWPFYVVVGLILAAIPVGYYWFFEDVKPVEDAPPPKMVVSVAPVKVRPVELKLAQIAGPVQIRRARGDWKEAAVGDVLQRDDAVRTGDNGTAVLHGGDTYEVQMDAATEVSVQELSEKLSAVSLEAGMATAIVKGGGRHTIQVRAGNSDAAATTGDGTFTMSNNGSGTVALAAQQGQVDFSGAGKLVIVHAGEQSLVRPGGQGPSAPVAVSASLLLKVRWPADETLRAKKVVVTGESVPGAQVRINGQRVIVDSDGKFALPVALAEGKNPLRVDGRAPGSAPIHEEHEVTVDTRAPSMNLDADIWGRNNKKK